MAESTPAVKEEAGPKPASSSLEVVLSTALVGICNYYIQDDEIRKLVGTAAAAAGYGLAKLLRWIKKEITLWRLTRVIEKEIAEYKKELKTAQPKTKHYKELERKISDRQEFISQTKRNNLRIE